MIYKIADWQYQTTIENIKEKVKLRDAKGSIPMNVFYDYKDVELEYLIKDGVITLTNCEIV